MEVKNSTRAASSDFSRCFSLPGVQCILCLLRGLSLTGVQCIRCPRYRKSRSLTFFGRSILSRQLIGNRFAYDSKHACAKKLSERHQPISHQTGATNVCARLFMSRKLAPVPRTNCRPANRSISRSVNLIVWRSGGLSLASGSVTDCIERANVFSNEFERITVQRVRQQLDITRGPRGRTAPHQRTCGAVPCTQAGALSEIACDHRRARMHPAACECACVEGIPT